MRLWITKEKIWKRLELAVSYDDWDKRQRAKEENKVSGFKYNSWWCHITMLWNIWKGGWVGKILHVVIEIFRLPMMEHLKWRHTGNNWKCVSCALKKSLGWCYWFWGLESRWKLKLTNGNRERSLRVECWGVPYLRDGWERGTRIRHS